MQRERRDTGPLHGYIIPDSESIGYIGWEDGNMLVMYLNRGSYLYLDVPYQRAVAAALAESVGSYINANIKPHHQYARLDWPL
jgi:hypothetical protein